MYLASHLLVFVLASPGLSMGSSSTFPDFSLAPRLSSHGLGMCLYIYTYTHTYAHTEADIFTLLSFLVTHVAFPLGYNLGLASYWLESN